MVYRLGIVGPFGSGKSHLAQKLTTAFNEDVRMHAYTLPFAYVLKTLCSYSNADKEVIIHYLKSIGITNHYIITRILQAFALYPSQVGVKNRKLLQVVGTDIIRNEFDESFWIRKTDEFFYNVLYEPERINVLIHDDVRFANEAVTCDVLVEIVGKPYSSTHISESRAWSDGKQAALTIPYMFTELHEKQLIAELTDFILRKAGHITDQELNYESFMRESP